MFNFGGAGRNGLAPGNPRHDEAYAHYQEGVRLGYIKKNPMDMSLDERYKEAQQQAQELNSKGAGGGGWEAHPDGTVKSNFDYDEGMRQLQANPRSQEEFYGLVNKAISDGRAERQSSGNNAQGLLNQYYQARQQSQDAIKSAATAGLNSFYKAPTSFYQG